MLRTTTFPLRFAYARRGLLLALLLLALLAFLGFKAWRLSTLAQALRADLAAIEPYAQARPDPAALESLGPILARARADALALRAEAAPLLPITPYLGWVPTYGPELVAAGPLLDTAADLSIAADESFAALAPIALESARAHRTSQELVAQLAVARPRIDAAADALSRVSASRTRLSLASLSPPIRDRLARLDTLLPIAQDGLDLVRLLPDLLAANGRREYLLIAQSPDELRATGGSITGAGTMTVDHGRLVDFTIGDSVDVDKRSTAETPAPPQPLRHYLGMQRWSFQHANWSPDFPTSARAALDLYQLGRGQRLDHVAAFNTTAIQMFLTAIGPVSVEGIPYPITPQNALQNMREPYNMPGDAGREAFKQKLALAMIAKVQAETTRLDLVALARATRRALNGGHLLFYVQDPTAAAILARNGWDGAVRPGPHDFLMVVDSNVGNNKANPNIRQAITYTVDLSDLAAPAASLTVQHIHRLKRSQECQQQVLDVERYGQWMAQCYYDYLRVLAPAGSALLDWQTRPTPQEWLQWSGGDDGAVSQAEGEAGTRVLTTFLTVPFGESRDSRFRYRLPASVLAQDAGAWRYRLKLQKQPGRETIPLMVSVRLPAGAALLSSSAPPKAGPAGTLDFSVELFQNQEFEVVFR